MGQVAPPTYPARGATNWDTSLVAIIESIRTGLNGTDTTATGAASTAGTAASTAGQANTAAVNALNQAVAAAAAAAVIVNTGQISYDAVNKVWPPIPTGVVGSLCWHSTNDKDAPRPPQMRVGDSWIPNPLSSAVA